MIVAVIDYIVVVLTKKSAQAVLHVVLQRCFVGTLRLIYVVNMIHIRQTIVALALGYLVLLPKHYRLCSPPTVYARYYGSNKQ